MKKIILILILSILTLSSCSKEEEVVSIEKKDFIIDAKKIGDFDNEAVIKKTGKMDSVQNISLSSNANGRVKSIFVKSGDNVVEGQTLAILDDSIANYYLTLETTENNLKSSKNGLENAQNNLEKAKLNYESTKVKLDKAIGDIERNLNNLELSDSTTSSSIEIDKINNSINRLNIEYTNLLTSNDETLSGFKRTIDKEFVVLNNYLSDVIYFSDEILGVTELNKTKNDDYDKFLGIKDTNQKRDSENKLRDLIYKKDNVLKNTIITINSEEDYKKYIELISSTYEEIVSLLTSLDTTLTNTTSSIGSISESQISIFRGSITGYKAQYNSYKSSFLAFSNSVYSFLETYKNTQASLLKQIENLEKDKNIYIKSLDLNKDTVNSSLVEAKTSRELTLKNLDLVIKDAQNAIKDVEIRVRDAEISYKKALNEVEKLSIKSPITGIIGDVVIDKGQEVFSGTPTFTILSEGQKEVTISFNQEELNYLSEGTKVYYNDGAKTFTGTIYSISKNADANLKYEAKVTMPNDASYIGNILDITIPIKLENKLLPVNIIKINNLGIGTINYLTGSLIEQMDIKVGKIYSDEIEIYSEIDKEINVILNYIDNYDSEKFNLKVNQK